MSEEYTAQKLVERYDGIVERDGFTRGVGVVKEVRQAAMRSLMYGEELEDRDLELYLSIIPPYSQVHIALKRIKNRRKIRANKFKG